MDDSVRFRKQQTEVGNLRLIGTAFLVGATLGTAEAVWVLTQLHGVSPREVASLLLYGWGGYGLMSAAVAACIDAGKRTLGSPQTPSDDGYVSCDAIAVAVATPLSVHFVSSLVHLGRADLAWLIPGCILSAVVVGLLARWVASRVGLLQSSATWLALNLGLLVLALLLTGLVKEPGPLTWYVAGTLALLLGTFGGLRRQRQRALLVTNAIVLVAITFMPVALSALDRARRVTPPSAAMPPSVLLISVDTLRPDRIGCYGNTKARTPHIDAFAKEAILFTDVTSAVPLTGPSHTTMLTGLYHNHHGAYFNGVGIRPEVMTLADVLAQEGYRTAAFVSGWTLKDGATRLAPRFDRYDEDFSRWPLLPDVTLQLALVRLAADASSAVGHKVEQVERKGGATTERVLSWLSQHCDRPFFVLVHYFDPHAPYAPPAPYDTMHDPDYPGGDAAEFDYFAGRAVWKRIISNPRDIEHFKALYDGEISYADAELGRLLGGLSNLGLSDNTLVIFTSDHGESLTEHDFYFDHGEFLYETCVRVPLIIRFPDRRYAGARQNGQVRLVDLAPTVLDTLGIKEPISFDGTSLLPLLVGTEPAGERVSFGWIPAYEGEDTHRSRYYLRQNSYKLIWNFDIRQTSERPAFEELYDLGADPNEQNNLISDALPLLNQLRSSLERWREEQEDRPVGRGPGEDVKERLHALGYL